MSATWLMLLLLAYLLGSISFAVVLSRWGKLPDPRQFGSGNPGASNMLRLGRRSLAIGTLCGDAGKGALAVALGAWFGLSSEQQGWLALAAIVGHMLPLFHHFRGGKGVAAAAGALLVLAWPLGVMSALLWAVIFAWQRMASLASMFTCLALLPLTLWLYPALLPPISLLVALILLRHRLNLGRLLTGKEPRFRR